MAACLNDMSRNRYKDLEKSVAAIGRHIENELEKHTRGDVNALILPLTEVDASMGYSVGGKNANLGELSNMLDMPVPPGFAVTIQASSLALLRPAACSRRSIPPCARWTPTCPTACRTLPVPCRT